jgi:hypothetical protein
MVKAMVVSKNFTFYITLQQIRIIFRPFFPHLLKPSKNLLPAAHVGA